MHFKSNCIKVHKQEKPLWTKIDVFIWLVKTAFGVKWQVRFPDPPYGWCAFQVSRWTRLASDLLGRWPRHRAASRGILLRRESLLQPIIKWSQAESCISFKPHQVHFQFAFSCLALRIALAVQSWPPGNCSNANMQNQTWPLRLNSWEQGGVDLNLFAPTPTLTNVHIQPPLWPYRI